MMRRVPEVGTLSKGMRHKGRLLAMALGYAANVRNLFGIPKFDTMEELDLIRRKSGDKRAYTKNTTE